MKQVTFTVTLTFHDPIAESDIKEVADNVAEAIKSHANSAGIAPAWPIEDSSTFTTHVQVAHSGIILNETDI